MTEQSFEHGISYITARIAVQHRGAAVGSIGTGFFYQAALDDGSNRSITLLISNKHVFLDPTAVPTISLNEKDAQDRPAFGRIKTFEQDNFSGIYYSHPDPDVDLACVNASGVSRNNAFYKNLDSVFLDPVDYDKIVPSQAVIFVGYPENCYDVVHNLPLVRSGSIASLPSVDFNGKGQIVIDAQVFQGSSGSPVFVAYEGRYYLLGVVTETMIRHSKLQTLPSNIGNIGVQQILGLGIVIKQRHVQELISHAVSEFLAAEAAP